MVAMNATAIAPMRMLRVLFRGGHELFVILLII